MGMDRLLARLEDPRPFRVGELAEYTGYSVPTIRKLLDSGALPGVRLGPLRERRIPVQEARRVLVDLRILQD